MRATTSSDTPVVEAGGRSASVAAGPSTAPTTTPPARAPAATSPSATATPTTTTQEPHPVTIGALTGSGMESGPQFTVPSNTTEWGGELVLPLLLDGKHGELHHHQRLRSRSGDDRWGHQPARGQWNGQGSLPRHWDVLHRREFRVQLVDHRSCHQAVAGVPGNRPCVPQTPAWWSRLPPKSCQPSE